MEVAASAVAAAQASHCPCMEADFHMVMHSSQTQEQAWQVPSVPAALDSRLAAAEEMAVEGMAAEGTGSS